MIPMKPDGEVDTGRMVALIQIAEDILPKDALGKLSQDDLDFIKDVQTSIANAKAAGVENPMITIPMF